MISGSNMLPKGHPCLSIHTSGIRSAPPEMATVRIHLVTVADTAAEHQQPIADLVRTEATLETAGLTLAESKQVLHALQRRIVDQQVAGYRDAQRACPHCGKHLHLKERGIAPFCTLFGLVSVPNPRWHHCDCQPHEEETFRPLDYAEKGSSVADAARTQQHMRRATRCRGCPRFPKVTDRSDYWSPQASQ